MFEAKSKGCTFFTAGTARPRCTSGALCFFQGGVPICDGSIVKSNYCNDLFFGPIWIGLDWKQLVEISYTSRWNGLTSTWKYPGASWDWVNFLQKFAAGEPYSATRVVLKQVLTQQGAVFFQLLWVQLINLQLQTAVSWTSSSFWQFHSNLTLCTVSCSTFLPCFPCLTCVWQWGEKAVFQS